jgi:hypothetical protein
MSDEPKPSGCDEAEAAGFEPDVNTPRPGVVFQKTPRDIAAEIAELLEAHELYTSSLIVGDPNGPVKLFIETDSDDNNQRFVIEIRDED